MADWLSSMQQTFEYYIVDPGTWKDTKLLDCVKSCTIERDADAETRGSASMEVTEPIGECYIRVYLITIQNGVKEKHPLGTFLVQTPAATFNGKIHGYSIDAYTPLLELKEKNPPIGYSVLKNENIMDTVHKLTRENARAPVVPNDCSIKLFFDFVSETDDTWLSFLTDLMANAKYKYDLDEMGRILFSPEQNTASLQPVWTYGDDNSSILYPEVSIDNDLYGIPNVVEVIYSSGENCYYSKAVNDDPNSSLSTVNRGREIVYRTIDPEFVGDPTENQIDEYAKQLLRNLSSIENTISYTHGYCPVRVGDCIRFDYSRAGLNGVKAKVISQSIECKPGCPVTEKAVFTTKLWR